MKAFCVEDVLNLGHLAAGYVATGLVPARYDRWVVTRLMSRPPLVRDRWVEQIAGRMRMILEAHLQNADYDALARRYCEMFRENQWMRWRATHGRAVPVRTTVTGLEHLVSPRVQGNGTILWGMSFCENLAARIGLHRAGIDFVQLSAANHGAAWPATGLGVRVVAPFYTAAETPYLAERLEIPADDSLGYMHTLIARLNANHVVAIGGDGVARRQNVPATVLGKNASFAPGAAGLAWKCGSALLPVHVVREGPLQYRIVIDSAVEVDRGVGKRTFIERAVNEFASRLEKRVQENPSDYAWYSHIIMTWVNQASRASDQP